MVPVPTNKLIDMGLRPFDPVNAAFTLEAWVLLGAPSPVPTPLAAPVTLFGRTELAPGAAPDDPPAWAWQWRLLAEPGGGVVFEGLPSAPRGEPEAWRVAADAEKFPLHAGRWTHVAVTCDASSASRQVRAWAPVRLPPRHAPPPPPPPRQIGSGVPCAVRIFVGGALAGESLSVATDVPLAVDGDRNGAIYVLPNGHGRLCELRLWASARSDSDIAMLKDTNLTLAVKKKAVKARIHEATCECATCKAAKVRRARGGGLVRHLMATRRARGP